MEMVLEHWRRRAVPQRTSKTMKTHKESYAPCMPKNTSKETTDIGKNATTTERAIREKAAQDAKGTEQVTGTTGGAMQCRLAHVSNTDKEDIVLLNVQTVPPGNQQSLTRQNRT